MSILLFLLPVALANDALPVVGIQTYPNPDAEQLVRDYFLKEGCANVSNIQRIGDARGLGYFDQGSSSIGFPNGIILASGKITNAEGPNQSNEQTSSFGDDSFDADLKALSSGDIFDNVGIEFDFVPQKEWVSFSYVFASEEYCEFVGSIFNDVFGFFVSGPGINGPFDRNAINVARIPDTDEYVAINNVNHEKNREYYVKNELRRDAERCRIPYQPAFENEIEYDGFTVRLKATFKVIPCQTYHIRLVIGDVGDDQLDSAVFLAAKSFDIGPEVSVTYIPDNGPINNNLLTEGCNSGSLVFTRTDLQNLDQDLPVNYSFTENSEALPGIDFPELPQPLIIPANALEVRIPFAAIPDQLTEGQEALGILIQSACECLDVNKTTLRIADPAAPALAQDTLLVCQGEQVMLTPVFRQGTPPFTYRWEDGSTQSSLTIPQFNTTTGFRLTVTDFCGDSLATTLYAQAQTPPGLTLSATSYTWCAPQITQIPIQLNGSPPWSLTYLLNDQAQQLDNLTTPLVNIPVNQPGILRLLELTDARCSQTINTSIRIEDTGPKAEVALTPLQCPEAADARIDLTIDSPYPYQIDWNQEVNQPETPSALVSGIYAFTITDSQNCTFSDSIIIQEPDLAMALTNDCAQVTLDNTVYIPSAFSPNQDGQNDQLRIFTPPDFSWPVLSWQIFDRWGNLLFEATHFSINDPNIGWDGTSDGQDLSSGVYLYRLELETATGIPWIRQGSVTLVR